MTSIHHGDRAYVAGDGRTGTYIRRDGDEVLVAMPGGTEPQTYPAGWVSCPDRT